MSFGQSKSDTTYFDANCNETLNVDSIYFYAFKDYKDTGKRVVHFYYATGELYSEQEKVNNLRDGYSTWYYKNGNKIYEGDYYEGIEIGQHVFYNDQGIISGTPNFTEPNPPSLEELNLIKYLEIDSLVIIQQPAIMPRLYRGYKNEIEIGFRSGCELNVKVVCPSCDTIYKIYDNRYVITPGVSRDAWVEAYEIKENGNYELVCRKEFKVSNIPDPIIYIGTSLKETPVLKYTTMIFTKNSDDSWINSKFKVIDWKLFIGKKTYSGSENIISEESQKKLQKLKDGKRIKLIVNVIGEDNRISKIETYFTRGIDILYRAYSNNKRKNKISDMESDF